MATYRRINYNDRLRIEVLHNKLHYTTQQIGDTLGFHNCTISREIRRGHYMGMDSELVPYSAYSADIAQREHNKRAAAKGAPLKIGRDFKLAEHIEDRILNHKYSPAAVLGEIQANGLHFDTSISTTTLYRYIDQGLFLRLSNKDLPCGKRSNRPYNKLRRISYSNVLHRSIEQRPAPVEARNEFGHWEMDTVVGKAQGKSTSLLVLTERATRREIVLKLKQRTTAEVVKAIDKLHRRYKSSFKHIFKTITVDNGREFQDAKGIEKGGRTTLYYCHPYSSWERGSNENANKLIRRFIPKGTSIEKFTHRQIERLEHWINNYPRKIHGYKTSEQLFQKELEKLSTM